MRKSYRYLVFILFGLVFSSVTALLLMTQCGEDIPEGGESDWQAVESQGDHPGWEDDLKTFKYISDPNMPMGIRRYFRRWEERMRDIELRSEYRLVDVQEMGPSNIHGRVRGLVVDVTDPDNFVTAGISGGIWRYDYVVHQWIPIDDHGETPAVSFLAQNPFQPEVLYAATGEVTGNSARIEGEGILKSTDGGRTFELLPGSQINDLYLCWRVVCSRTDTHTLYVASKNGLYVSHDAGETFQKILYDECTDIEVTRDSLVYVAIRGKGIYRLHESNLDATEFLPFAPEADLPIRRIDLSICESNPMEMYAIAEDRKAGERGIYGVFASRDGGKTWKEITKPHMASAYAWYTMCIQVHPDNPDFVVVGSIGAAYSNDGGNTWKLMRIGHVDQHYILFDPHDPEAFYLTNDGGIYEYIIEDDSVIYLGPFSDGLNITQFYTGDYFMHSDQVIGGTQDNGTLLGKMDNDVFRRIWGGDGGFCYVNKDNDRELYLSIQRNVLYYVKDLNTSQAQRIAKTIEGEGKNYFITPFYIDPEDFRHILLIKKDRVYYTENRGQKWTVVTEEFTQPYAAIILPHPDVPQWRVFFIGGKKGELRRLVWDGTSVIENVPLDEQAPEHLKNDFIRTIVQHPTNPDVLYVGMSNYDNDSRIWRVENIWSDHAEWIDISSNLPKYLPINSIAVAPQYPELIALGTDYGLFLSYDEGEVWHKDPTVPRVPVFTVKIRPTDSRLYAYTHGRGVWTGQISTATAVADQRGRRMLQIQLFPNPVRDVFLFRLPEGTSPLSQPIVYGIYNQHGDLVMKGTSMANAPVSVSSLPAGAYVVQFHTNDNTSGVLKFVKW